MNVYDKDEAELLCIIITINNKGQTTVCNV